MRGLFALILVAGLGLAAYAASMVSDYISQKDAAIIAEREAASTRAETIEVVALRESVKYGERITPEKVGMILYAKDFAPEGVFTSMEDFFPQGENVLRVVLRPMEPLEPVLAIKVTDPGDTGGLASRLGQGMRAFTIRTDVTSGVSGFLRPGDNVSVYWTGSPPGGLGEVTRLILDSVELLAVDQTDDANRAGAQVARTVTVKVSNQEVLALTQAQSTGRLSLALVGYEEDQVVVDVREIDQRTLLGIEEVAPEIVVEVEQERICQVRKRVGAETVLEEIPCTE